MKKNAKIGLGDIVQLKSGGPKMVVVRLVAPGVTVECWWSTGPTVNSAVAPVLALKKVKP